MMLFVKYRSAAPMRMALCAFIVALSAAPVRAQEPTLPLNSDEAGALSRAALAELMFSAAADQVVAVRVDDSYFSPFVSGATFLLKPRPAIDEHIVQYAGACSVRRVRIMLDGTSDFRSVEDVETDTAWMLIGPMFLIQDDPEAAAGDPPADVDQRAACARLTDFGGLVESPDAAHLMLASTALGAIPLLLESGDGTVTCGEDKACSEVYRTALRTGRLKQTGPCEDPSLNESLGITPDQTCITASLILPGGNEMTEYDTLEVTASGDYDYPNTFTLKRVLLGIGTTIVD